MEKRISLFRSIAFSCFIPLIVAEVLEHKARHHIAAHNDVREGRDASLQIKHVLSAAVPKMTTGRGLFTDSGNVSLPNTLVRTSTFTPKGRWEIDQMWLKIISYKGRSEAGMSRERMKELFRTFLKLKVIKHLSRSVGGMIFEFGERNDGYRMRCMKRPSLTLHQVRAVARASFGIPDYNITYPPCSGNARKVRCNYDGGICCRRPQVEFIGRYYDTAVAAMALGATREEAFAPLMHARILAYALESCDPYLSFRTWSSDNDFLIKISSGWANQYYTVRSQPARRSLISFPVAYEVLYELYNTMLIERIRSRGQPQFPTHGQMRALNDALYYQKLMASAANLDIELHPDFLFPESKHFQAAGLAMATSSRLAPMSRMPARVAAEVNSTGDFDLHPQLRLSSHDVISIFERRTMKSRVLDSLVCNRDLADHLYYPYKYQQEVWDKYEGCCASECRFMALYGKTFGVLSSNCCAGCNRHSCVPNSIELAEYFAKISAIETSTKANSGPEEFTFTV